MRWANNRLVAGFGFVHITNLQMCQLPATKQVAAK